MGFLILLYREIRYFTNFHNKMYQFLLFFQPLLFLAVIHFMNKIRGTADPGEFVTAAALISMWSYVLYSSGSSLIGERWKDTLNLLIASPASLFQIIFSKTISNSVIAFISMILSFAYGRFIFGYTIGIEDFGLFFLGAAVLLLSLSVIGLILAAVFVASQNAYDYQNLLLTPVLLICGVFIPVQSLPGGLQAVAYALPMTWGIRTVHEAMDASGHTYISALVTAGVSAVYFAAGYIIIKRIELILRRSGKVGAI